MRIVLSLIAIGFLAFPAAGIPAWAADVPGAVSADPHPDKAHPPGMWMCASTATARR